MLHRGNVWRTCNATDTPHTRHNRTSARTLQSGVSCFQQQLRQSLVHQSPRSQFRPRGTGFAEEATGQSVRGLHSHDQTRFMYVDRITTWPQLAAIGADWNALAGGMPFRSWDWLATWWKHYGGQRHGGRELYVLAVYADADERESDGTRKLVWHRAVVPRSHRDSRQRAALVGKRRGLHRSLVARFAARTMRSK